MRTTSRLAARPARRDEDVLGLHVAVDELRLVDRGERLEDAAEERAELGVRDGPGARETRRERLRLDVLVRDVEDARLDLARLEVTRQARVIDGADEAVRGEEAVDGAAIARRFATEDLQRVDGASRRRPGGRPGRRCRDRSRRSSSGS